MWCGLCIRLCDKFPTEFNSERILKIGQYLVKLWARVRCLVFLTHGVIFSIGNGQPRERALCQLYRHTFVPYGRRPLHETTRQSSGDRMDCRYRKVDASVVATNVRHGSAHYLRAIRNQGELGSTRHLGAFSWDH